MAALIEPAGADPLREGVARDLPTLVALYTELHAHPELAFMETRTAARMAAEARAAGLAVTERVGGTGVVAVLDNGPGPVVLIRADMDGLPVREETGLPYASRVTGRSREGEESPVMHACGHDLHMAAWVGAARRLAALKAEWRGRIIFVAQPAEERVSGARAMLADGLYPRFGAPTHILAFHDSASQPAGEIGVTPGPAMAAVDTVDIRVLGVGGHGAYPHLTKDPVVLASRIVVGLQTIVSREVDPQDAAVVTVGAIEGGTKHNIIPDEVRLKITLRSFSPEQRARLVEAVKRTARGEAIAMGMAEERMPEVIVSPEGAFPTVNTPDFAREMLDVFARRFPGRVKAVPAVMAAEDFNEFGRAAPDAKTLLFWVGAQPRAAWDAAGGDLTKLPPLHSARFAPDPEPTIAAAAEALSAAALHMLARP
jgi:hippurate hydrolase